jgi:hypothetical protein
MLVTKIAEQIKSVSGQSRPYCCPMSIIIALLLVPWCGAQVARQDLSTADKGAAQIDEAWQKSSSQFDKRRDELFAESRKRGDPWTL